MRFSDLRLSEPILRAIEEAGYKEPTPIQAQAIPLSLKRRDIIGIAQTGTGKTAAFTLPILSILSQTKRKAEGIRALIIAPTRELVTQIRDNIETYSRHLDIKVTTVYGGVGEGPQIESLQAGTDIVIATPGRLIDLMDQGHINFSALEFFVLDEADRMLDMGFLPPIRKVARKIPRDHQTLLFSATLSHAIEKLSREFLTKPALVEIGTRSDPAKTVRQCVYEIPRHLKFDLLVHLLDDQDFFSILIFCRMKHGADRLAKKLSKAGIAAEAIHGDRTQNQRQRALDKFKASKLRVLVGTDVAARGIDVSGVTHVINFDFPTQTEDYIHRIGRTGRAKAEGDAITFVEPGEHRDLFTLEKFIKQELERKTAKGFDYDVPPPPRKDQGRKQGGNRSTRSNSRPSKGNNSSRPPKRRR